MHQNDLNRAVARVTGETVHCVRQLGFLLDGSLSPLTADEMPGSRFLERHEKIDSGAYDEERSRAAC